MGSQKSPHATAVRRPTATGVVARDAVIEQAHAHKAAAGASLRALSPSTVAYVQRTAGNQAAQRLLAHTPLLQRTGVVTIQRAYEPSSRQTNELKRKLTKWEKAYTKSGGQELADLAGDLADYADSHSQALLFIDKMTYEQWSDASGGTKAADLENRLLGLGDEKPKAVEKAAKDPLDAVRQKIKGKGWDLGLFGADDLQQILLNKESDGWEVALGDTYQRVLKAKQDADLHAKLLVEYSSTKTAGDLIFTNGILAAVWNLGHLIATSPNANINTTIGGEYADGVILAAANAWHGHGDIGLVTNIHVPGNGNGRIQDKSTRPNNPDPSRGRQCDFISYWKGNKVNVHVNSDVHH